MTIFFDTETTGKAEFRLPPEHPSQPHIVQLAAIMVDDNRVERASMSVIIAPDGFSIPKEAADIHGITTEIASRCGVPLVSGLYLFSKLCEVATDVVAHNMDFDYIMMRAECARLNKPCRMSELTHFCTMRAATDHCKLPGNYGKYKWPKLEEAYRHFMGSEFVGAHDALADVRGCAAVYFAMKDANLI